MLSGGSKPNGSKHGNPLNLGTPFNYCGGRAFALSKGKIHHVCIKEECNHPLPENPQKEHLIIYRIGKDANGGLPIDIERLATNITHDEEDNAIPIFWEPTNQQHRSGVSGGKGVAYVGHWKCKKVTPLKNHVYLDIQRCARIEFEFDRHDERTSKIINRCCDKTCDEIDNMSFDDVKRSTKRSIIDDDAKIPAQRKRTKNAIGDSSNPIIIDESVKVGPPPSAGETRQQQATSALSYSIFQIDILLGQERIRDTRHRPFIRVLHNSNNSSVVSFQDLRIAINEQLDLPEPCANSNFHFCIDQLDLSIKQEPWNVFDFIQHGGNPMRAAAGGGGKFTGMIGTTTANPFRIAIKPHRR